MVCDHPKLTEPGFCDRSATDELIYSYDEGGYFEPGPDFGCVHHTTGMVMLYQGARPENVGDKPEGDLVMEVPLQTVGVAFLDGTVADIPVLELVPPLKG